jgi:hypothetical protein
LEIFFMSNPIDWKIALLPIKDSGNAYRHEPSRTMECAPLPDWLRVAHWRTTLKKSPGSTDKQGV